MLSSESLFEPGFLSWESHEPLFNFHSFPPQDDEPVDLSPNPSHEPVNSNSGSEAPSPISCKPNRKRSNYKLTFGSIEPDRTDSKNLVSSGSDDTRLFESCLMEERKRRRMISNRESARRSRVRKQNHLENLRNQLNRLKLANRELTNGVRFVVHQNRSVQGENEYLRSEAVMLRQRLWDIRQVLLVRQLQQHLNSSAWPCNNVTSINEHSLIA